MRLTKKWPNWSASSPARKPLFSLLIKVKKWNCLAKSSSRNQQRVRLPINLFVSLVSNTLAYQGAGVKRPGKLLYPSALTERHEKAQQHYQARIFVWFSLDWPLVVSIMKMVKITSRHLLSEECDHLGEVDWSGGLSNLEGRDIRKWSKYLHESIF